MNTEFNDHIYHYSENVSDFLIEYLNEENNTNERSGLSEANSNPEITFLEQQVAALEGGVSALAVKSFNKAKLTVIKSLLRPGDNIVSLNSATLYHKDSLRLNRNGIDVRFPEDESLASFEQRIDANTKLIYIESISSENFTVPDFRRISDIARAHNIPVLADNTLAGAGYLTRPLKNGADLVISSTRQWLTSHKNVVGALIVDGGSYDWHNGKFPHVPADQKNPDWLKGRNANAAGNPIKFSITTYFKKEGNINLNKFAAPADPLSLVQDLEDLPVKIRRQSDNALALAYWLKKQEPVENVHYAGLASHPGYYNALTYFRDGFGSGLSFTLKDVRLHNTVSRFIESDPYTSKFIRPEADKIKVSVPAADLVDILEAFSLVMNNAIENVRKETSIGYLFPYEIF